MLIKIGISLHPDNIFGVCKNLKSSTFQGEHFLQAVIEQFCQIIGTQDLRFSKTMKFNPKNAFFEEKRPKMPEIVYNQDQAQNMSYNGL